MTDDALDVLRELVAAIERAECPDAEHFELDAIDAELDRARALLAAQEPRPEPVAYIIETEMQDGSRKRWCDLAPLSKGARDACDFGEPIPLYARTAWRESALTERQRAEGYTRDAARYRKLRDALVGGGWEVRFFNKPTKQWLWCDAQKLRDRLDAMSAQGDA